MATVAPALEVMRKELNSLYPARDKSSDGGIGDSAHAATKSDHNPNSAGYVRARDFDKDGIPVDRLVRHIVALGKKGDPRCGPGAYVIWNRVIWTHTNGWNPYRYSGTNPHTGHVHFSIAKDPSAYKSTRGWGLKAALQAPAPHLADRWLRRQEPAMKGHDVLQVQKTLNRLRAGQVKETGVYDQQTANIVLIFQKNRGMSERGVGPETWKRLRQVPH